MWQENTNVSQKACSLKDLDMPSLLLQLAETQIWIFRTYS